MRSRLTGMGEIALNLAHEIRNPLGSIALFATALARDLETDAALGPLAEQIVVGVQSLEHLVANALEFAKPRRMSMTRVDLTEVLAETLIYVSHPLRQKAIELRYDFDLQRQAWIAGDAEQLKQVFLNLMINAIQAMEEEGTLALELRALVAGGWEVTVGDDGVGIPEELLDKIFDPFFTTREKGSGIGLAVVHTILMAHGAQIEVASRPAAGTSFRISFPAMREFEEG
jgi:signal transduction histidine kinase